MVRNDPTAVANSERDVERRPELTVVGIGASAGGIEALLPLLRAIPADTGMGFVVIMHLDPTHPSQLVEVLSRATTMKVQEAVDGAKIEANRVYVISPNTLLRSSQGLLRASPRSNAPGPPMPIDCFLTSLAEDFVDRTLGVVLSGTGTDGTLGLRAIKGANGITFAQDASAQHSGMPESAIDSECVDFVLEPSQIASELVRLSKHPFLLASAIKSSETREKGADPYADVFRLLRNATRVDYANYKRSTMERRIQRRMLVHRIERIEEYLELLERDSSEVLALHQNLLIHVTRFFREPPSFAALGKSVFSKIVSNRSPNSPIRIWVPGCSTGEEVYSLAIALIEFLGTKATTTPIKIFATDISESTLARARAGHYLENIAGDVSPERLERFFVKDAGGYQIRKSIRDLCVFARHDVTRDPPFSVLDLVSCRNLLIYLGPTLQKRALAMLHYSLKPGSFLTLGASETIGNLSDLFDVQNSAERVYVAKAAASPLTFDFGAEGHLPLGEPIGGKAHRDKGVLRDLESEVDRALLAYCVPASVVVDANLDVLQFRGSTAPYLTPAPGNASLNLFKMAREGLLVGLRTALAEVRRTDAAARCDDLRVRREDHYARVSVGVVPLKHAGQTCFAIFFEDMPESSFTKIEGDGVAGDAAIADVAERDRQVALLHREIEATKEFLQTTISELESSNEELKVANEEVVSSNEELQSTNEELQTAKEELQATNEELNTVNEELLHRNLEATRLGDDLSNVLRSAEIPIVMVDRELRVRRFTPSAVEVLSLRPSDVGRPITETGANGIDAGLGAWMKEALEAPRASDREIRDSTGRWTRVRLRPYRNQEDATDGVVLSVVDIDDEKKRAQEALAERSYAEDILGTVHIPLAVLDSQQRLVSVNSAFCEFFRVSHEETQSRFLRDLGNRQWDVPTLTQLLTKTLSAGDVLENFVVTHSFPSIGKRTMLLNARRLSAIGDRPPSVLLAIEDVTERERAVAILQEEKSRESRNMEALGRLAGGVAHDFNNLMTVVNGYCEILGERLSSDRESNALVSAIHTAGSRAASLTQQLLAFGRRQMLRPAEVDLNEVLRVMKPLLRRIVTENIRLQLRLCDGPTKVFIDPSQLEQVVLNLCINARDAMVRGGNLILETSLVADPKKAPPDGSPPNLSHVCLRVRDDGDGMDEATLARVFEPYFTTKELGKGSGLGLATAYGIVKQSFGEIHVTSEVGVGTTFTILLPVAQAPQRDVSSTDSPRKVERANAVRTILVVDDEQEIVRLERSVLEAAGYHVLVAGNGGEALRVSSAFDDSIDLLITDVLMPGMGGLELARTLSLLRPGLRILFASGHSDELLRQHGMTPDDGQAVELLRKPFSMAALVEKVGSILRDE